ncbi:SUMF1/EgtB/PvdO family nonheme iron enzyme [Endozoicomonas sp. SM1973]|uniref:SUMF1/EgtB/PvdO family nonheme iron enzyme n=1 Tax=Spartinivicinus marinus TaxID=2994442 RepID=A0A853I7F8_9GAMM|nr:SUMF1/EgtB/PvdO family nonheme iron enzyme [Spartinivicinus marinus]MCX4029241.1 SUMF1/EgtB/PvdO family nonheme iron enzyme [Spartinivicinus marinus]NYZ65851.1 SUMF1/EgtB/PvdO family nonheme iron enzyme [Spartinivicinus marinus]
MRNSIVPFLLLCIILLNISGCSDDLSPEELEKRTNELLARTKENMLLVQGGSFIMGNQPANYKKENPHKTHNALEHKVTLSDYYISKYETTLEDYQFFAKVTNHFIDEAIDGEFVGLSPKSPVNYVTWEDANAYCQWLANMSGEPYRLPTEAEWEYAARSRGQDVQYATDDNTLQPGMNTAPNEYQQYAAPIDTYPPNPLGVYGMETGYAEWVSDWYSTDYFFNSPEKDPKGPQSGEEKVFRGARVNRNISFKYLYTRKGMNPSTREQSFIGFRCAKDVK